MGLFVLYFGTKKRYKDIPHHTIWMGKRYEGLLNDIFNKKILANDFSLYLHRPTATDKKMAPKGCDCFYVLSPVPNLLSKINWSKQAESYKNKIIEALENTILPKLSKNIDVSFYMTPNDFEKDYLSLYGSGFQLVQFLLNQLGLDFTTDQKILKTSTLLVQEVIRAQEFQVLLALQKF